MFVDDNDEIAPEPAFAGPSVTVFVNSKAIVVPATVSNVWEARGVLGVPRGLAVAYEFTQDALSFEGGYTFEEGERFEFLDFMEWLDEQTPDEDDGDDDKPWSRKHDWWKAGGQ